MVINAAVIAAPVVGVMEAAEIGVVPSGKRDWSIRSNCIGGDDMSRKNIAGRRELVVTEILLTIWVKPVD